MRRSIFLFVCFISFSSHAQSLDDLIFGTENTFDIVTWNIENFPKNGQNSINYVTQIVEAIDADFIAIQEVSNQSAFQQVVNNLADYNGFLESTDFDGLALLYKPNVLEINNIYRIYSEPVYWNAFPRAPMIIDVTYNNQKIFIINNHLKCCGDGTLNLSDNNDEETRRYEALNLLKTYIDINLPNQNVILLGDLNDELSDIPSNNVFQNLIDDATNYLFTDYDIALGSNINWSYPSWPSHLDHILITNELFDEFSFSNSSIETIKVDDYLSGGWSEYDENVTDHRPVGLKLFIDSNLGVDDMANNLSIDFNNYPNPFNSETTFSFKNVRGPIEIKVYNVLGQKLFSSSLNKGQTTLKWHSDNIPNGLYIAKLFLDKKEMASTKIIVSK
jgi:endonuclease/exonuclease/phosphatase family metal-dependent hydrolase